MKITQKDIAQKLGVSTSLVSRVLSGQASKIGVDKKKIDLITNLAKELNYVPSSAALALKGKSNRTIGVVVYNFEEQYFSLLIQNLQKLAHFHNYSLLLVGFLNRMPKNEDLLPLHKHTVDGIIILGSFGDLDWTNSFKHLPIARIGHGQHENLKTSISVDEIDAMRKIFDYLVSQKNLSKIAYVSKDMPAHIIRQNAFVDVSNEFNLKTKHITLNSQASDFETGKNLAKELLKSPEGLPEAVLCATDLVAMGVINQFNKDGVNVPKDISVIGFDDIPSAATYIPEITTFKQPVEDFTKEVFEAIITKRDDFKPYMKGELIIRGSSI